MGKIDAKATLAKPNTIYLQATEFFFNTKSAIVGRHNNEVGEQIPHDYGIESKDYEPEWRNYVPFFFDMIFI